MDDIYFPSNACVLACSGPSLNTINVRSLGLPVVAVSTSIRTIHKPDFWVLADYVNEMHGETGKIAYSDPDIIKVVPVEKVSYNINPKSLVLCEYDTATRWPNIESTLFTGKQPFIRGPHKSVTFAIQWLHYIGVKTIIWAGNDLSANSMKEKYCYNVEEFDMKKQHNYQKTLDQTSDTLKLWYPIAKKRGFSWFSWNCGEFFESIVPKFNENEWTENNSSLKYKDNLKISVCVVPDVKKNEIKNITKKSASYRNVISKIEKSVPVEVEKVIIPPIEVVLPDVIPAHLNIITEPREIVSERRMHLRNTIKTKKNLRSK